MFWNLNPLEGWIGGFGNSVAAIDRLSLVFVIILVAIFLGEALGWRPVLGALLMIAGALFITL